MIDILKYSAAETLEKNFQEIKFSLSIELDFKIPNFYYDSFLCGCVLSPYKYKNIYFNKIENELSKSHEIRRIN